jgi:hypothetical protein
MKDFHIREMPAGSVGRACVDWRGKLTYRVYRVFFCRVYINGIMFINELMTLLYYNYLYCYICLA